MIKYFEYKSTVSWWIVENFLGKDCLETIPKVSDKELFKESFDKRDLMYRHHIYIGSLIKAYYL